MHLDKHVTRAADGSVGSHASSVFHSRPLARSIGYDADPRGPCAEFSFGSLETQCRSRSIASGSATKEA